jgi:hypothetical protein
MSEHRFDWYAEAFEPKDGFGIRPGENPVGLTEEENAMYYEAQSEAACQAVLRIRDERRAREAKEREQQAWAGTRAGQLLKQLGDSFAAYRECVEQDPRLQEKALAYDEMNQKIFERMKTNMDRAHSSPRCRFEKANGTACRAPKVRGKKYCHMHLMLEEARPERISLPGLGDANAIQAAIAKGAQALVDGKLEQKQASILGYYLQLALSNVSRLDFEEERESQKIG